MRLRLFIIGMSAGMSAFLVSAALAADGTTLVDTGPLVAAVIQIVTPIVVSIGGVLGLWVLGKLAAFLGLKIDDRRRAALEQGLDRAIGYAMSKLEDRAIGGIPLDVKSKAIAVAADYAKRSVPGAIGHFKIGAERLAEMVESRLEGLLIDPALEVADPVPAAARRLRSAPASA